MSRATFSTSAPCGCGRWSGKTRASATSCAVRAPAGNAAASARSDWVNAGSTWNLYLDRAAASPAGRQQQLELIRQLLKSKDERAAVDAAHFLERLHLDLHAQYAGRINQARAVFAHEGAKAAVPLLQSVDEDLGVLLDKGKTGQLGFKGELDELLPRLRAPLHAAIIRSLELLQNDWTSMGNYYWLRQHVRRQLELWQQ